MSRTAILAACAWWLVLLVATREAPRYWLAGLAFLLVAGLSYLVTHIRFVDAAARWFGAGHSWQRRAAQLYDELNERGDLHEGERAALTAQRDAALEEAEAMRKERDYYKPKFQRTQDDLARCAGEVQRLRAENETLRNQA